MESGRECSIPQSSVICSRPSDSKMSTRFFILAGKRDSRCHSTTSFRENVAVAETSYQMLEMLSFGDQERA